MKGSYPLGRAQWRIIHILLDDGGDMTTTEIAEELRWPTNRAWRKLLTLVDRGLVEEEKTGRGRGHATIWRLRTWAS